MGISVINEDEVVTLGQYSNYNLYGDILFMGRTAAVDIATNTLYISQNVNSVNSYKDLEGTLSSESKLYKLYIVNDGNLNDIASAMKNGSPLTLIADRGNGTYTSYNVILTQLPVLNMSGTPNPDKEPAGNNRPIMTGELTLWNSRYPQTGEYSVLYSDTDYNIRGDSVKIDPKSSYKLSLKDKQGGTRHLDLLGHGYFDDDWILNGLSRDDTNIKEKFFLDLWEDLIETTDYNYQMSAGEYVEAVVNGNYSGVYLLQNRIDEKYLNLDSGDVLIKGLKNGQGEGLEKYADAIPPNLPADVIWEASEGLFELSDVSHINLQNWVDCNMLIDVGRLIDNVKIYNCFYIIKNAARNPEIYLSLWDNDVSFGAYYKEYAQSRELPEISRGVIRRPEYDKMLELYPDLDKIMAQRWFELRETVFSQEHLYSILQENQDYLLYCGAESRDKDKWGYYISDGADSVQFIYDFIDLRLQYMDSIYSEYLF